MFKFVVFKKVHLEGKGGGRGELKREKLMVRESPVPPDSDGPPGGSRGSTSWAPRSLPVFVLNAECQSGFR